METIKSIDTLSRTECEKATSIVHFLRKSWFRRHALAPYYTLGTAIHLDSGSQVRSYLCMAKTTNQLLKKHFDWLYQRLTEALEVSLGAPVNISTALAVPGFHIFLGCKFFEVFNNDIHFDLQHNKINSEMLEKMDFSNTMSFTLPIALPRKGAGLNLWDITYQEMLHIDEQIYEQKLKGLQKSRKKILHPYKLGQMIVHSGSTLHQAAMGKDLKPDDDRITLQGQAFFSEGSWQLYW